jgi:acyl dehydratase
MTANENHAGSQSTIKPRGFLYEDFIPGQTHSTGRRTITEADHVNFTRTFGFFEPLFMDREYIAKETPYGHPSYTEP